MIIASICTRVGLEYSSLPGANTYLGVIFWGKERNTNTYMTQRVYQETKKLSKKFFTKKYTEKYFQQAENVQKKFNYFIKQTRKLNFKKLSNQEIINILTKLWQLEVKSIAFYSGSQEEPLILAEEKIKKILATKFSSPEILPIFEILINPREFDEAQKQEFAWFKLINRKNKLSRKDFINHGLKYPFVFWNNYDLEKSFKYFKNKFKKDKQEKLEFKKHLIKLKKKKNQVIKEQNKILNKINNKELCHLSWLFQKSGILRMRLKHTWAGVEEFLLYDLFQEVAKRIKEDYFTMVSYYQPTEIINALADKDKLTKKEIINRKKAFYLGVKNNKAFFYSGQQAINQVKKKYPELFVKKKITQLIGTPACLGKARGEVAVINVSESLSNLALRAKQFKANQILVTEMTQPNMVPLMKKAAAIVTNEGGLTSHAAVISREFGIPCIVGTKCATQVLKDGDLVEVDANKGVVKILK